MHDKQMPTEQMKIDLPALLTKNDDPGINVFRRDLKPDRRKELLSRHLQWLSYQPKEYPRPGTPYRIGVYIRYYNQTKYENYLE